MSEDLTNKLPKSDSEKLNQILTTTWNLERRFDNFEGRFERLEIRVDGIDSRLEKIENTVEERLHDTRPICQRVVADIQQLQEGQQRLEKSLSELNIVVREVSRDQIVINDSLRRIQLDLHSFDERLHSCEVNRRPPNSST